MIIPRSLVYPSVTTDVDKLGLNAFTIKVGKDVKICSFSTDLIFVVIDAVLVITVRLASGWIRHLAISFCPLLASRGTS